MAYVTGTANTLNDLLAAIQNACTSNGWSLSGNVLSKGGCCTEIAISGSLLTIRGGTGVSAGALTGACDTTSGTLGFSTTGSLGGTRPVTWTWPVAWFVHIGTSPDEVYVIVRYATSFYQTLAFGKSAMPGLSGTGNWYCGCVQGSNWYIIRAQAGETSGSGAPPGFSLFARSASASFHNFTCGVHHALDSSTWSLTSGSAVAGPGAAQEWASMAFRQPNSFNAETILQPIRVNALRSSGFVSPVLECAHARFVSIANLQNEQIITLGGDKWKVYPWWGRGEGWLAGGTGALGSSYGLYSGTFGHAIRYDGP